jgi:hypothetical protein
MRNLSVEITDDTGVQIDCRIELSEQQEFEDTTSINSMSNLSSIYSISAVHYCSGIFERNIGIGSYQITITRGKLYWPCRQTIEAGQDDVVLHMVLHELVDVKALNLYSFDAHSHVSRDKALASGNLEQAARIMKGEDYNFLFAGSPYDQDVHIQHITKNITDKVPYRQKYAEILEKEKEKDFILDIGNELVKGRYGHIFMMNFIQTPPFNKYYDNQFDSWMFARVKPEPTYGMLCPYEAIRQERGDNSVAVAAHPASWWYDNGNFITNIASTIGFDILAGTIDAMVIMGYQSDSRYYQELWFDALNNGYFLPGIAENDQFFDTETPKFLQFKTYAYLDEFTIDALCKSVKKGRCIVSSGPVLELWVNGELPGAVFRYTEKKSFDVRISAYRCWQADLSKVQIIVNGSVYKEYDIDQEQFYCDEKITVDPDSYILAKCYDHAGNTAITNPVYIRSRPFVNDGYLANVTIHAYREGSPVHAEYWLDDSNDRTHFYGTASLKMKPSTALKVSLLPVHASGYASDNTAKVIRLFELDELQQIFRNLYLGSFHQGKEYTPGEVPARFFKLREIKEILDHVNITVE